MPQFNLLQRALRELEGKPFFITITESGQVKQVEGLAELLEAFLDKMEKQLRARLGASKQASTKVDMMFTLLRQVFKETFSEETLQNMFSSYSLMPKTPVGVGDTWVAEMKNKAVVPIISKCKMKVTQITQKSVRVKMDCSIQPGSRTGSLAKLVSMSMQGTETGEIVFDRSYGWITSMHAKSEVKITVSQPGSKETPKAITTFSEIDQKGEVIGLK